MLALSAPCDSKAGQRNTQLQANESQTICKDSTQSDKDSAERLTGPGLGMEST